MGVRRKIWHFGFGRFIEKRGPRAIDVIDEVHLSRESLRIDFLIVKKPRRRALDETALSLRKLWGLLPAVTVVEYKSTARPYRSGDLDKLLAYTHLYYAHSRPRRSKKQPPQPVSTTVEPSPKKVAALRGQPHTRADLSALLVVPRRTRKLDEDAREMGLRWVDLSDGYFRLEGGAFRLHVIEAATVAKAEGDDVLYSFADPDVLTVEARRFWAEILGSMEAGMRTEDLEGYEVLMQKLLESLPPEQRLAGLSPEQVLSRFAPEQRLAGLAPEQRLAGLAPEQVLSSFAPEQRLAGLTEEQAVLAMPDAALRALSDDYIATLSEATQAAVRKRTGRA